jgi:hypothetical protein
MISGMSQFCKMNAAMAVAAPDLLAIRNIYGDPPPMKWSAGHCQGKSA